MKLRPAYETDAYISVFGYYAIKQPDYLGGDDAVVLLTRDQVIEIVKDMQECLLISQWGDCEGEENG